VSQFYTNKIARKFHALHGISILRDKMRWKEEAISKGVAKGTAKKGT